MLSQNKDQLKNVIIIKITAGFWYINRYLVIRLMEVIILLYAAVVWFYVYGSVLNFTSKRDTNKMQTVKLITRIWKPVM